MKVVDDFLPKDDFKTIQDILLGSEFGWFYNSRIDFPEDKDKDKDSSVAIMEVGRA